MASPASQPSDDDVTIIQIDYEPGTPDPSRVFRAMAGLIDACHQIDQDLARSVSATIEPQVLLERVEAGSIRAILRTLLVEVSDDALRTLNWKPLVGQYLVRGKHAILKWLDGRPEIITRREVLGLQEELSAIAPPVNDTLLPPAPVPVDRLLWDVEAVSRAVIHLRSDDGAKFVSRYEETRIETRVRITAQEIETLLTESVIRSQSDLSLLVKKPDYLGNSMWEFRLGDRVIEAKILDDEWLQRFRAGGIPLQPGDALRSTVLTESARGFEGQEVTIHYSVLRVIDVIRANPIRQDDLLS